MLGSWNNIIFIGDRKWLSFVGNVTLWPMCFFFFPFQSHLFSTSSLFVIFNFFLNYYWNYFLVKWNSFMAHWIIHLMPFRYSWLSSCKRRAIVKCDWFGFRCIQGNCRNKVILSSLNCIKSNFLLVFMQSNIGLVCRFLNYLWVMELHIHLS